jgi:hypothetical protein
MNGLVTSPSHLERVEGSRRRSIAKGESSMHRQILSALLDASLRKDDQSEAAKKALRAYIAGHLSHEVREEKDADICQVKVRLAVTLILPPPLLLVPMTFYYSLKCFILERNLTMYNKLMVSTNINNKQQIVPVQSKKFNWFFVPVINCFYDAFYESAPGVEELSSLLQIVGESNHLLFHLHV